MRWSTLRTCCSSANAAGSGRSPAHDAPGAERPGRGFGHAGRGRRGRVARRPSVAKIHYEADGAISAERFIAALTDFGPRRPELWPNLDAKYFQLHEAGDTWAEVTEGSEFLGGVWARERYDWS